MANIWQRLWRDESGALLASEYLILGTLLTIGLIVGISSAQTALVTELEDFAQAILGINAGEVGPAGTVFKGNEQGIGP